MIEKLLRGQLWVFFLWLRQRNVCLGIGFAEQRIGIPALIKQIAKSRQVTKHGVFIDISRRQTAKRPVFHCGSCPQVSAETPLGFSTLPTNRGQRRIQPFVRTRLSLLFRPLDEIIVRKIREASLGRHSEFTVENADCPACTKFHSLFSLGDSDLLLSGVSLFRASFFLTLSGYFSLSSLACFFLEVLLSSSCRLVSSR